MSRNGTSGWLVGVEWSYLYELVHDGLHDDARLRRVRRGTLQGRLLAMMMRRSGGQEEAGGESVRRAALALQIG